MRTAIAGYSSIPPKRFGYERTRHLLVPGMLALVIPWLIETAIAKADVNFPWALRVHVLFVFSLLHWDKLIAFAFAGFISAMYGSILGNSPKQRYLAALFPVVFEVMEWIWLLQYPLPSWIDPAAPPYRFLSLPISVSIGYWIVHILLPATAAMGAVGCFNRWFAPRARL